MKAGKGGERERDGDLFAIGGSIFRKRSRVKLACLEVSRTVRGGGGGRGKRGTARREWEVGGWRRWGKGNGREQFSSAIIKRPRFVYYIISRYANRRNDRYYSGLYSLDAGATSLGQFLLLLYAASKLDSFQARPGSRSFALRFRLINF